MDTYIVKHRDKTRIKTGSFELVRQVYFEYESDMKQV